MEKKLHKNPTENLDSRFSDRTGKIVKYSENVFLPITNLCRNNCSYCGFRKEPEKAKIMSESDVLKMAKKGKRAGCSEALLTLGERPEENYSIMKDQLDKWGYNNTVDYLEDLSKKLLKIGVLPHTNAGILKEDEMKRLSRWNASMGLMLETTAELSAHEESEGKNPEKRLEMIRKAGELKIPFTTGILIGIGEEKKDRTDSLEKIKEIQENYGHIQELIIQPFEPKQDTEMENRAPPFHSEILETVKTARELMPNMNIQIPPNLVSLSKELFQKGVNDLGGISKITPDFINPDKPWPSPLELEKLMEELGYVLRERLTIHPKFATDSNFMSQEVESVVNQLLDDEGFRSG